MRKEKEENELNEKDSKMLDSIANRDQEAFKKLFERYYPLVYRFILRITFRPELAEEAANDTLFEVWRKAGDFRRDSKVSTWIFGIAYYKGLKSLRGISDFHEDIETMKEMVNPADGPEKVYETKEIQGHIREALKGLSVERQATVELAFFNELPYSEIADIMGCTENTVKTRIFRTKKQLSKVLAEVSGGK